MLIKQSEDEVDIPAEIDEADLINEEELGVLVEGVEDEEI